jgi:hypothetical protein
MNKYIVSISLIGIVGMIVWPFLKAIRDNGRRIWEHKNNEMEKKAVHSYDITNTKR